MKGEDTGREEEQRLEQGVVQDMVGGGGKPHGSLVAEITGHPYAEDNKAHRCV